MQAINTRSVLSSSLNTWVTLIPKITLEHPNRLSLLKSLNNRASTRFEMDGWDLISLDLMVRAQHFLYLNLPFCPKRTHLLPRNFQSIPSNFPNFSKLFSSKNPLKSSKILQASFFLKFFFLFPFFSPRRSFPLFSFLPSANLDTNLANTPPWNELVTSYQ